MKSVRCVVDTNVLISSVAGSLTAPPGRIIQAVRESRAVLVTSPLLLEELEDVLARPHLQKFIKPELASLLFETIDAAAVVVTGPLPQVTASRDPDDNIVLATALAGDASLIVSGDKRDLVSLGEFKGIPIRTPAQAVEMIEG